MARIESVDLFLLQVPDFNPDRDPVKDTLLVRVGADGYEGWGECEAAPLVSLVAFVTPESHSTSRPVAASVIGQKLDDPKDLAEISRLVAANSMNVLQTPHIFSGVEMALWDLLGKMRQEPVYRLLGYGEAFPKLPYVVMPFGPTPQETFQRMRDIRASGFHAVKTGWNGFGRGDRLADRTQLDAARAGLGRDARLFLDVARIWGSDVIAASAINSANTPGTGLPCPGQFAPSILSSGKAARLLSSGHSRARYRRTPGCRRKACGGYRNQIP